LKLIIEPADGVAPLLTAIRSARKSVEIAIFRLDRTDIETALTGAVEKGVKVTASCQRLRAPGSDSSSTPASAQEGSPVSGSS
jgi:hypothetical protein